MAAEIDPEVCYLAWYSTIATITDPACTVLHYKGILVEQIQVTLFTFLSNSLYLDLDHAVPSSLDSSNMPIYVITGKNTKQH
jgi:hypothetical protein